MNLALFFVLVLLFVVLTPGVVVTLPARGSKLSVALTHGLIFGVVWSFFYMVFDKMTSGITSIQVPHMEGNENMEPKPKTKRQ